nr:MAG TPA: hypothetical protein [Bacteriophage sp.]
MTKIRPFAHHFFASFYFQTTATNFSSFLYFYTTS